MQKLFKITILLTLVAGFLFASCTSSKNGTKKGSCACPNKKGLIGY